MAREKPQTFEDIVVMTADLPMVSVGTNYGTPAVQVKGKSFARMRTFEISLRTAIG